MPAVFAQGFDWEMSARMPFTLPTMYVGPTAALATLGHTTNAQLLEQVHALQPAFVCAQYTEGKGSALQVGVQAEWWAYASTAVQLRVSYHRLTAEFNADSPVATLGDGLFLQTRYSLSTNLGLVRVEALSKFRIGLSKLWVGCGISSDWLLKSASEQRERVLTPSGYTFPGTNSQDRLISNNDVAGLRTLVVNPLLVVGYDVDMGKYVYSAPALLIQIPGMNYSSQVQWSTWVVGLQYTLLFGLSPY